MASRHVRSEQPDSHPNCSTSVRTLLFETGHAVLLRTSDGMAGESGAIPHATGFKRIQKHADQEPRSSTTISCCISDTDGPMRLKTKHECYLRTS